MAASLTFMASGEPPLWAVMVCGLLPGEELYIVSAGIGLGPVPTITEGGCFRPISLLRSLFSLQTEMVLSFPGIVHGRAQRLYHTHTHATK